ncbi:hypothetical protein GCM10029978_078490 [Actinoallomurus acanthiterrae]
MSNPSNNPSYNPIAELAADPQATADRLAALPQVAGVQVAGLLDGALRVGAAGTADAESGAPVTAETRFRPGSITKLLTASLVMKYVADARIGLEDPLNRFVPGPWGDDVLIRHLISHSSGVDAGDIFLDTGDDDDCVARYVEHLAGVGTLFPAGATFSYCNGGFVLAGRVIELVSGRPWHQALRAGLLDPAGMTDTGFATERDAEKDLGIARGHLAGADGLTALPRPIDNPVCSRALGPAGGTLVSTAGDLAGFVAAHLRTPGTQVMRTLHAPAPGGVATMRGAGLGWMIWANAAQSSVRIGGGYPGQSGIIAADPATDTAVVVLTNSDQGINAVNALLDAAGPPPGEHEEPADLGAYAGRYASHVFPLTVSVTEDGLRVQAEGFPALALTPQDRITFTSPAGPVAFFGFDDDGAPRYLRSRMRVWRRTT